jgi:hypothetical protein
MLFRFAVIAKIAPYWLATGTVPCQQTGQETGWLRQ